MRDGKRSVLTSLNYPPPPFFFFPLSFSLAGTQDAVLVGLHTCGDLAPSTLRMFRPNRSCVPFAVWAAATTCSLKSLITTDRVRTLPVCTHTHTHTHTTLISISMVEQVFKQDKPCGIAFLFIMFFPAMCTPYRYLFKK